MNISREKTDFSSYEKIYAIDTNIVLSDNMNIMKISQGCKNIIIIPDVVMDEIDSNKSGFEEINYESREFSRMISQSKTVACYKGVAVSDLNGDSKEYKFSSTRRESKDFVIEIVSLLDYKPNKYINAKNLPDQIIVDTSKIFFDYLKSINKDESQMIFLSLDIACENRAVMSMLNSENLTYKKKEESVKEYFKNVQVDSIEKVEKNKISDIDKDYKIGNFNYQLIEKGTNIAKRYIVKNGKIEEITNKLFQGMDIKPKNMKQEFALALMLDSYYNIVLLEAKAGSGKTLLTIAAGMRLVKMKKFEKIIYIRNSIESIDKGEDVGYLPGGEDKFKIYNHPLYDTLNFLISLNRSGKEVKPKPAPTTRGRKGRENTGTSEKKDPVKELMSQYNIETMWVGEMRGRTLSNAFVIIDEVQNLSKKTMQTVISRIDKNSKLVAVGSNAQIDNIYTNKYTNGLSVLETQSMLPQTIVSIGAITLDKVERGPITEWAEEIFKH